MVSRKMGELSLEIYADAFSVKQFLWESQNQNTQNSPVNLRIISLEYL